MRVLSLLVFLGGAAAAVFLPVEADARRLEVRMVTENGVDQRCPTDFARVVEPSRTEPKLMAPVEDFAYAAAAAGPLGTALLLGTVALAALIVGLWWGGVRGGLRCAVQTFALGVPLCVGLFYASCFLEGRIIRLSPQAAKEWATASLHTQTNRTTGFLAPRDVVQWHFRRGFRVLNVSDRNTAEPGMEALEYARNNPFTPPLLVIVGEEWHGHPDLVLVNVKRSWKPSDLEETIEGVHREGGAVFVAHPWAKLAPRRLEQVLAAGADGAEVVNGVIHGGALVMEATSRQHNKALLGVIDYKYGPHVNALTLLPARDRWRPRDVVEAIRKGQTRVLYAVPGGAVTGEAYKAAELGISGAAEGLRTLRATPRKRRAVWFAWLAVIGLVWWVSMWESKKARSQPLSTGLARILFIACCVFEFVLTAGIWWKARAILGPIPVHVLLGAAAVVAVPLLASSRVLSCAERRR